MKLPNGETCRKCEPDTGACEKHIHLDPCYQANVVEPSKRSVWKNPVMIGPSPEGLSFSWVELNVIHAALEKVVEDRPSGQILSTYTESVWRRVNFQKMRNDVTIDHAVKYGAGAWTQEVSK